MMCGPLEKWLKDHQINYNYDILPEFLQAVFDKNEISTFNDYTGEINIIRRLPDKNIAERAVIGEELDLLEMKNGAVMTRKADGTFLSYLDAELAELIRVLSNLYEDEAQIQYARVEKIDGESVYVCICIQVDVRPPRKKGNFVIVHVENDGYASGAERDGTYTVTLYDTEAKIEDKIYIIRGILPLDLDYDEPIEEILDGATLMSKFYYINNKLVTSQEYKKRAPESYEHHHHYFHMLPWWDLDMDFEEINPRAINKRLRAITHERHSGLAIPHDPMWAVMGEPSPHDDDELID